MTPEREIEITNKVNSLLERELKKEETPQLVALVPLPGKHIPNDLGFVIRGVEETFNRLARILKQVAKEMELETNEVFRALGATLNKMKKDLEKQAGTDDPTEDVPSLDLEGLDSRATNSTVINTHVFLLKRNIEKYLNEGRPIEIIEIKKHEVETVRLLIHYEINSSFVRGYRPEPKVIQTLPTDQADVVPSIIALMESKILKREITPKEVKVKSETRLPNDPTWIVSWYDLAGNPNVQNSFISEETLK